MAKISKSTVLGIVALVCAMLGLAPSAMAATATVPQSLTQQGRLLDDAGMPVKNPVTFTFSLYTAATGGTAIWFEQIPVTPDDGYFSARLGETKQFDATIFDGSRAVLFLGIKVGNDAEMTPRQQITSVPFALLAGRSLTAALADEATHAANADLAKNATNAATAANATLAANATNAAHATNADLARLIAREQTRRSALAAPRTIPSGDDGLDVDQVMQILPHRFPFLMVDRIISFETETKCVGVKTVTDKCR